MEFELPRNKLNKFKDPKNLLTEELISIIIGHGTRKHNVYEIAKDTYNFLKLNINTTIKIDDLLKIEGLGKNKAFQIISSLELGRRFYKNKTIKLSDEDWDFNNLKLSERQYGVHSFHHYTAKFIPQIPKKLIQRLTKANDIVVDPFMGSGTTLVEAKFLGCHSYGFDTNPLAIKITKAKTMLINENKVKEINLFLDWINKKIKDEYKSIKNNKNISLFTNSNLWFRNDVSYKIKIILDELNNYSNDVKNFIEVGLSNLLKGMSNARMDSVEPILPECQIYTDKKHYYREVNNLTRDIPVFSRVYYKINRMKKSILQFNKETDNKLTCKPIFGDAREMNKFINKCNFVVTSPPYWSAQNYEKLHMLSIKLFNLKTPIGKEIGRNYLSYLEDIKTVFLQIAKILNGYFTIIIGEDNKKNYHEKIYGIGENVGFKTFDIIKRRISNQVSNAKQIKNEYIYIFKT